MATVDKYGNIVNTPTNTVTSPLTISSNGGQISNPTPYSPNYQITKTPSFTDSFLNPPKPSGPQLNIGPTLTSPTQIVSSSAPAQQRQTEVKNDSANLVNSITQTKQLLGGSSVAPTADSGVDPATGLLKSSAPQTIQKPSTTNMPGYEWVPDGYGNWKEAEINSSANLDNFNKDLGSYDYTQDPEYISNKKLLDDANRALGIFTPEEQSGFKQAGTAAGAAYDSSIIEAKQNKYYGMPEAIQSGLRAGGLMNTQIAGTSANGEEGMNVGSVVGRGGELEKISSAYDFNIAKLESAKNAAIQNAEVAARQAAISGKKEDRQYALDQMENAKNAFYQQQELIDRRKATLTSLKQYEEKQVQEKKDSSWKQVSELFSAFGSGAFDDMDDAAIEELEVNAGMPKGTLQKGLEILKKQEAKGELNLKEVDGSLYNISQDANGNIESQLIVKAAPKSGSGGKGLTPAQINSTVNSIAGAFDNEPIVKNYNKTQEGYQTIQSIGVDTKSPTDDIAFVYAFAKIMDPESVVREGEYNTIQKYAQSWASAFGFKAKRIFSNENFLSKDAKQKMLNTLTPKISTVTSQYNNLHREYQRQMDDARAGAPRQLTDYAGGNVGEAPPEQIEYQGNIYNVDENGDMTLAE